MAIFRKFEHVRTLGQTLGRTLGHMVLDRLFLEAKFFTSFCFNLSSIWLGWILMDEETFLQLISNNVEKVSLEQFEVKKFPYDYWSPFFAFWVIIFFSS